MNKEKEPGLDVIINGKEAAAAQLNELRGVNLGKLVVDIIKRNQAGEEFQIDVIFYVRPGVNIDEVMLSAQKACINVFGHTPKKFGIEMWIREPNSKLPIEVLGQSGVSVTSFGFTIPYGSAKYFNIEKMKEIIPAEVAKFL